MFNKIRAGLYRSLMWIALIFVIVMIIPSIAIFANTLYGLYESMATRQIDRSIASCRSFISSVMSSTDNLASNALIQQALEENSTEISLTETLDNACSYSIKINAITVYDVEGNVYSSSGVFGIPSLLDLQENDGIAEFFADRESTDYISLRSDCLIKVYENTPYNSELGILSYCRKVHSSEGVLLGYVFSDVFPSSLFSYFDYSDDSYYNGSTAIIRYDGGYLASDPNSEYNEILYQSDARVSAVNTVQYLIVPSARNFYGGTVLVAVPLRNFYVTIATLSLILIGFATVILLLVHLISKRNADNVIKKLDKLYDKMSMEMKF